MDRARLAADVAGQEADGADAVESRTMLEDYLPLFPGIDRSQEDYVRTVLEELNGTAEFTFPHAALNRAQIEELVEQYNAEKLDGILIMLLTYSQGEYLVHAMQDNRLPLALMASDDCGKTWRETGRCPLDAGSFSNIGFPDGRIVGMDVGRSNEERTGWCDYVAVRESCDGGTSWRETQRLLEGCAVYLWRIRRLRDGSFLVLACLYGTPWGPGRARMKLDFPQPGPPLITHRKTPLSGRQKPP